MRLTYFGAACWLIESSAGHYLIDPGRLLGDGISDADIGGLPPLRAILVTHRDPDHVNRLGRLDRQVPVYGPGDAPPERVRALPAKHGLRPWVRHTAYSLELDGQRLVHMGDSPRLEQPAQADLALVNVAGMACNVANAVRLGEAVAARVLLPMHHFQTPLTRRRGAELKARSARLVVELKPGSSWEPPPADDPRPSGSP